MYQSIIKLGILITWTLLANAAFGQNGEVKVLSISNPANNNGIQIGDVLTRTITLESSSAYDLPKTSLAIKGESKNDIELRDINVSTTKNLSNKLFQVTLSYQVFANAAQPVQMQLPVEHLLFTGPNNVVIDIPAWQFWYSPLIAEGVTNAKDMMQPQNKPELIAIKPIQMRLAIFSVLLAIGLLGLIYVNADKRYLPFMNGAFAQAHRSIKKLAKNQTVDRTAFVYMHQAFNRVYGANLFISELDQFLAAHPKFLKVKDDIARFFEMSNATLFANASHDSAHENLIGLSKRLRDCERGV
ncbi:MAG: nonribosomal peptide synthetase MxaA [Methylophilus sp.]